MSARQVYIATKKQPDLLWNLYVCRPLAAVFVSRVARSRVTPDQITLLSFVVACGAAAILLAVPGWMGLVLGVVVFELSYVLDCADGMLARWRGSASQVGHLLDFLMDELKAFLILASMTVRLYLERDDPRVLMFGMGGLVCLATGTAITTFLRRPELAGSVAANAAPGPPPARPLLVRAVLGAGQVLGHYPSYIWLAAVFGRVEVYLLPYVVAHALNALRALATVTLRFSRAGR